MAHSEGRRDHGLWLLARIMESAPLAYELMQREAQGIEEQQPDPPLPEGDPT